MTKVLRLSLATAALVSAIGVSSGPLFARGGGANIMNSPGYQRRLQESRQQVSQPQAQPSATHRRKWRHGASTDVLLALAGRHTGTGDEQLVLNRCFY